MKKILLTALLMVSANSYADSLVQGKVIRNMDNNTWGKNGEFTIRFVEGIGSGNCPSVTFKRGTTEAEMKDFDRAYSLALLAFTTGYKVWVASPASNSNCNAAIYLQVDKG